MNRRYSKEEISHCPGTQYIFTGYNMVVSGGNEECRIGQSEKLIWELWIRGPELRQEAGPLCPCNHQLLVTGLPREGE